jgi:hypothetical protein
VLAEPLGRDWLDLLRDLSLRRRLDAGRADRERWLGELAVAVLSALGEGDGAARDAPGWRWRRDLNPRRVAPHALSSSAAGGSDPFGWVWSRLSRSSTARCGRP